MLQRHRTQLALAVCHGGLAAARRDGAVVAACTFRIRGDGRELKLLPAGRFRARDGRPGPEGWHIDAEIARRVIERAAARDTDLVIDYEHQTLYAAKNGQPAPAAAWIAPGSLEWRDGDGLYATDVRWTERARAHLEAGEYRYFSPVFLFEPGSGEVLDLRHGALTNDPALDGLPAIAEQAAARFSYDSPQEGGSTVTIRELLGLAQDATDAQVQTALAALKSSLAETLGIEQTAAAEAVGEAVAALKTKADAAETKDQEIAALKANLGTGTGGNPDPSKYVPVETVEALRGEIAQLRTEHVNREVDELVQAGLDDGRLLPAQEQWARDLGGKDLAALKTYLEQAQPIAALTRTQTGGTAPEAANAAGELTDTQKAICRSMGLDEDAYKKQLGIGAADTAAAGQ